MRFDVIILDPPSFSRADGEVYSFVRDYPRLLQKCARVAGPGATVYALTNYGKISPAQFRAQVDTTLRGTGRRPASLTWLPHAEDFDAPPPGTPWKPSGEGSLIGLRALLS
jgi:23S rRNA (cytosine1962-C5)-methyltransferase